jgi:hypothetical protein
MLGSLMRRDQLQNRRLMKKSVELTGCFGENWARDDTSGRDKGYP